MYAKPADLWMEGGSSICGSLRKSAFGRASFFLSSPACVFREVKCSNTVARQPSTSLYHTHPVCNLAVTPNSVCWHCCESFDGLGIRLPRLYDTVERVYHVYGWFCSPGCVKAYILENSSFDKGQQMSVFTQMLKHVYGITDVVIASPPRISLHKFGGPFSIGDFRKNVCTVITPPFVSYCMLLEERTPDSYVGGVSQEGKGTVCGLRKPQSSTLINEHDQICSPQPSNNYGDFLKTKVPPCDAVSVVKRAKKAPAQSGLGRYVK